MIIKQIQARIQSFKYAFRGLVQLFKNETNAKIHFLAAVLTIILGLLISLSNWEWIVVVICIVLVFMAEAFNTALEELTNLISPEFHPLAGKAKDLAAGGVLIIAIGALICGTLIFLPKIIIAFF